MEMNNITVGSYFLFNPSQMLKAESVLQKFRCNFSSYLKQSSHDILMIYIQMITMSQEDWNTDKS